MAPLAFTSTCTEELCDMRDDWDQFASADTVVLPISVDATATLKEVKEKYAFTSEFVSDFRRDISRWTHVENNNGEKRNNTELFQRIAALT